jgi:hypothetical protein
MVVTADHGTVIVSDMDGGAQEVKLERRQASIVGFSDPSVAPSVAPRVAPSTRDPPCTGVVGQCLPDPNTRCCSGLLMVVDATCSAAAPLRCDAGTAATNLTQAVAISATNGSVMSSWNSQILPSSSLALAGGYSVLIGTEGAGSNCPVPDAVLRVDFSTPKATVSATYSGTVKENLFLSKAVAAADGSIYAHDDSQLYRWNEAGLPTWYKEGPKTMFGHKTYGGTPVFSPNGEVMYVVLNPDSYSDDAKVVAYNISLLPAM